MDDIDKLLPKTLLDIKQNFGLDVMLKVWTAFGGSYIYIQKNLKPDNPLVAVLGVETAVKFCHHYQIEYLKIEKAKKLQLNVRNTMIKNLIADGVNQSCIARMVNLDVRQVERIAANIKNEKQQDLFS